MGGKKQVLLHVGMSKALSTYLQKEIFPNLSEAYFEGSHRSPENPLTEVVRRIMCLNPLSFDVDSERRKVAAYLESLEQDRIIISFEDLDGLYVANYRDRKSIIDMLGACFPGAGILQVIRRQDTWLESAYRQILYLGYSVTANTYLNYRDGDFREYVQKNLINIDVRDVDLHATASYYCNTFGRENVLILPFEHFLEDKKGFLASIYEQFRLPGYFPPEFKKQNVGFSYSSASMALLLNRFIRTPYNSLGFIPERPFYNSFLRCRKDKNLFWKTLSVLSLWCRLRLWLKQLDKVVNMKGDFLDASKRARIMDIHRESNSRLSKLTGLQLDRYGYH